MKSLLFTGVLTMGVAHTGAFLDIWEVPHVENHVTIHDVGRKLSKALKWDKTKDSLRDARDQAREENYSLYGGRKVQPLKVEKPRRSPKPSPKPMRTRSTSRK